MTPKQIFRYFLVVTILASMTAVLMRSATWANRVEAAPSLPSPTPTLSGKPTPSSAIVLAESEIQYKNAPTDMAPRIAVMVDRSHGVYLITDEDGDRFLCEFVPETHSDMGDCMYAP